MEMSCDAGPGNIIEEEVCRLYKGNLRLAILRCLKEGRKTPSSIVERLHQVTGGEWSPVVGSVNDILSDLEGFDLITSSETKEEPEYLFTPKGEEAYSLIYERVNDHIGFLDWILNN